MFQIFLKKGGGGNLWNEQRILLNCDCILNRLKNVSRSLKIQAKLYHFYQKGLQKKINLFSVICFYLP